MPLLHQRFWKLISRQFTKGKETTTTSGSMNNHIKKIHEQQRNFKCNSCGKSFSESANLKRHIKNIHEGQRNSKCDSCEKTFTHQLGDLKIHIKRIHEGQRNYKCVSLVEKPSLIQDI